MKLSHFYPKQGKWTMRYCALEPLKTQHTKTCKIVYTSTILRSPDPLLVPVSTRNDRNIIIKGYVFWRISWSQEYQPECNYDYNRHIRDCLPLGYFVHIIHL